jgi:hypothetical protein
VNMGIFGKTGVAQFFLSPHCMYLQSHAHALSQLFSLSATNYAARFPLRLPPTEGVPTSLMVLSAVHPGNFLSTNRPAVAAPNRWNRAKAEPFLCE